MSLAEFLLARIAEDEAAANYANTGVRWESWNRSWDTEPQRDIAGGGVRLFTVPTLYDEHIARHDPARVLAECEAKRAIVEWAAPVSGSERVPTDRPAVYDKRPTRYVSEDGEDLLRILAAPFRDHPDYDPAWEVS